MLLNFIMAVHGNHLFETQKSASIHHKRTPHDSGGLIKAFWREVMHLCKENIHI